MKPVTGLQIQSIQPGNHIDTSQTKQTQSAVCVNLWVCINIYSHICIMYIYVYILQERS